MMNLGLCYREGGRVDDALKTGQFCVEQFRIVSGREHRDTLNTMTESAMSLRAAGRLNEALALEEESLKLKRRHLPAGHPMTVESIEHLTNCYEQSSRKEDAAVLNAAPVPFAVPEPIP
jgi:hypothetical protein